MAVFAKENSAIDAVTGISLGKRRIDDDDDDDDDNGNCCRRSFCDWTDRPRALGFDIIHGHTWYAFWYSILAAKMCAAFYLSLPAVLDDHMLAALTGISTRMRPARSSQDDQIPLYSDIQLDMSPVYSPEPTTAGKSKVHAQFVQK